MQLSFCQYRYKVSVKFNYIILKGLISMANFDVPLLIKGIFLFRLGKGFGDEYSIAYIIHMNVLSGYPIFPTCLSLPGYSGVLFLSQVDCHYRDNVSPDLHSRISIIGPSIIEIPNFIN